MLLLLLGGVGPEQVFQAVLILAATALAAGSLGGLVALWRDRTFQALALTVLFLVLYLCLVRGLARAAGGCPAVGAERVQRVQQWLEPFLALQSVLEPPTPASRACRRPTASRLVMLGLARAAQRLWACCGCACGTPAASRSCSASSPTSRGQEPTRRRPARPQARASVHAAPGAVRPVGANPILWREISTRAYGRRPLLVKLAYGVVLALICYSALAPLVARRARLPFAAAYGLVPVGVLSLLLVAAQAATAITSERDTGALDLLLVTDLTPQEFIFGKLLRHLLQHQGIPAAAAAPGRRLRLATAAWRRRRAAIRSWRRR